MKLKLLIIGCFLLNTSFMMRSEENKPQENAAQPAVAEKPYSECVDFATEVFNACKKLQSHPIEKAACIHSLLIAMQQCRRDFCNSYCGQEEKTQRQKFLQENIKNKKKEELTSSQRDEIRTSYYSCQHFCSRNSNDITK